MTEDAKVLEDGPVDEPTKRFRGLAAVGDVVETPVMRKRDSGCKWSWEFCCTPADQLLGEGDR